MLLRTFATISAAFIRFDPGACFYLLSTLVVQIEQTVCCVCVRAVTFELNGLGWLRSTVVERRSLTGERYRSYF